ncbi:MAG: NADP-specific glutamate dehydrogenase [Pseudomonadota bacterium]
MFFRRTRRPAGPVLRAPARLATPAGARPAFLGAPTYAAAAPQRGGGDLDRFMADLERRNPNEPAFHQAVREAMRDVFAYAADHAAYNDPDLFARLVEPDRVLQFRVAWTDDAGRTRQTRAWRVQFTNALGPYKGGLRFVPDLQPSVLKFLGFEQGFKNALTGLPLGGAKGGAAFDPAAASAGETMRFCQALMIELHNYIGPYKDVPAGDIGVGAREIGWLYGAYKRIVGEADGALTGKGASFGGAALRPQATGYGLVMFVERMAERMGEGLGGVRVVISGSGAVALYAAERAIAHGARVLTLSDRSGVLYAEDGLDADALATIASIKARRGASLAEAAQRLRRATFRTGAAPWGASFSGPCDIALPCATQNELDADGAKALVKGGVRIVAEGANMPTTPDAVEILRQGGVAFAPGKAANAGGVAVSGFEMAQNAAHAAPDAAADEARLQATMDAIFERCAAYGETARGGVDLAKGANVAGFARLADAIRAQGAV